MTPSTVMIVDDSLLMRAVVRAGLEAEDYLVVEAEDGETALRKCRNRPPDVILLDIVMPGMDGYQVLAELKADPVLDAIPVVFLTGRTNMSDVVTALRAGAHDYLKKPFEPEELLARVHTATHVKRLQDKLREQNAALDRMTRTDALTGMFNRRHLDEELANHHKDAVRHGDQLCVLLLDIDHFKQVNDTYGHSVGDQVLRDFSQRLGRQLRDSDIAGRWGGEEFLVILPRTGVSGAVEVAERIRAVFADTPIAAADDSITVTVSGGCAVGPADSPETLLRRSDALLYEAKTAGRNRIIADCLPATPS